ncbi:MAG: hypothetical protein R3F45_06210 [Gammaproteobacteria bacterium]
MAIDVRVDRYVPEYQQREQQAGCDRIRVGLSRQVAPVDERKSEQADDQTAAGDGTERLADPPGMTEQREQRRRRNPHGHGIDHAGAQRRHQRIVDVHDQRADRGGEQQ